MVDKIPKRKQMKKKTAKDCKNIVNDPNRLVRMGLKPQFLYKVTELSHEMRISTKLLYKIIKMGFIHASKIPGGYRVLGSDALSFLKQRRIYKSTIKAPPQY